MKKCFALLLTLLLALGLTATAFAVEEEPPTRSRITVDGQTYEDITEVPITKLYPVSYTHLAGIGMGYIPLRVISHSRFLRRTGRPACSPPER